MEKRQTFSRLASSPAIATLWPVSHICGSIRLFSVLFRSLPISVKRCFSFYSVPNRNRRAPNTPSTRTGFIRFLLGKNSCDTHAFTHARFNFCFYLIASGCLLFFESFVAVLLIKWAVAANIWIGLIHSLINVTWCWRRSFSFMCNSSNDFIDILK